MRKVVGSLFVPLLIVLMLLAPALARNVGVYTLASTSITTALTSSAQTAITDLGGAQGLTITATFGYGSGGTTANVAVQTSLDGGTTWFDIAYFAFTTASATKYVNLAGLTAKGSTSYSALAGDGVNEGLIGDRLRAVITTTGTYANTTLSVRASVR